MNSALCKTKLGATDQQESFEQDLAPTEFHSELGRELVVAP